MTSSAMSGLMFAPDSEHNFVDSMTDAVCPKRYLADDPAALTHSMRSSGLILFLFGTLYYLITCFWWYSRMHQYMLIKRNFRFVLVSAFGGILQLVVTCLGTFTGRESFNCDVYLWFVSAIVPMVAGPIAVRLSLFHNKARFNNLLLNQGIEGIDSSKLIEQSTWVSLKTFFQYVFCSRNGASFRSDNSDTDSTSDFDDESDSMEKGTGVTRNFVNWKNQSLGLALHLSTKPIYGFFLLFFFCFLSLIFIVTKYIMPESPYGKGCKGCRLSNTDVIALSVLVGLTVCIGLYMLFKVRNAPDPLKIIRELQFCLAGGMIVTLGTVLATLDVGNVRKEGKFEWLYLVAFGLLTIHTFQCTYPILQTYYAFRVRIGEESVPFESVMANKHGRSVFERYLATEFSVENMYFVLEVEKYRHMFTDNSMNKKRGALEVAEQIYVKFLKDGALVWVNVGFTTKRDILQKIEKLKMYQDDDETGAHSKIFDRAEKEILKLMKHDSYPRFCKSSLYKELGTTTHLLSTIFTK